MKSIGTKEQKDPENKSTGETSKNIGWTEEPIKGRKYTFINMNRLIKKGKK